MGKDEGSTSLIKISFAGDPPRMNFALTRLSNGSNITDMSTDETSALGAGELAKIITDMGEALRRTCEATLAGMKPYQSFEVIIMVLPEAGFKFVGPGAAKHKLGVMDKVRFAMIGDDSEENVHIIQGKKKTTKDDNKLDDNKTIIVLQGGRNGMVNLNQDRNLFGSIAGDATIIDDDDEKDPDNDDFKQ